MRDREVNHAAQYATLLTPYGLRLTELDQIGYPGNSNINFVYDSRDKLTGMTDPTKRDGVCNPVTHVL